MFRHKKVKGLMRLRVGLRCKPQESTAGSRPAGRAPLAHREPCNKNSKNPVVPHQPNDAKHRERQSHGYGGERMAL